MTKAQSRVHSPSPAGPATERDGPSRWWTNMHRLRRNPRPAAAADMSAEEPISVAALSWVFELPRDLGLRQDTAATIATERTQVPGWEERFDRLPDWPGSPAGVVPFRRLRFRRARVNIGMPEEATQITYGDLLSRGNLDQARRRLGLRARSWRSAREWKTVCQLTQWYLGDEIPDLEPGTEEDESSPLRTDLAQLLAELDLWLQTYGSVAMEPDIGSISLHDLPPNVPWFLQLRTSPDAYDLLQRGTLSIHGRLPNLKPATGNDSAALMASRISAEGPDAYPLFNGVLMLFQAQSHALAGRGRQSMIDMGTAIESVVLRVIRDSMAIRGHSSAEIERVAEQRWKDLFNRDLLRVLGVPIGQGSPYHSKWWAEHYRTRIEAVHTGARIPQDVAMGAVLDSWELIDWIGDRLRQQPDLAPLGEVLKLKRNQPQDDHSEGD